MNARRTFLRRDRSLYQAPGLTLLSRSDHKTVMLSSRRRGVSASSGLEMFREERGACGVYGTKSREERDPAEDVELMASQAWRAGDGLRFGGGGGGSGVGPVDPR